MPVSGAVSAASTSTPAIVATHGRRWTARLQRAAGVAVSAVVRVRRGTANRLMRWPANPSRAGSSVSAAAITTRTEMLALNATPVM
jgi:hypothetical protein